jgi:two-component system sensor histidine kinase BaeS
MKLANQLSLILVGALLIAIAAMGAFFAFNLERGFVAYVNAEQLRQLDALAESTTRYAQRFGGLEPLLRDRRLWGRLVRESEENLEPRDLVTDPPSEGRPPFHDRPPPDDRPPRGGPGGFRDAPPRGPPERPVDGRGPPDKRGAPGEPEGIGRRFFLMGAERRLPDGERLPAAGTRPPVEREIKVSGRTLGYIVHYPYERVSRAEDKSFLRSQFLGVAFVALGLLVVGVLAAPIAARRWTRPLRDIGRATGRIARGELGVRIAAAGASEIEALASDVNAMAASLARLDESRKRWIAQSAHELRTPLMVLRGEIDALQDGVRPVDARALASLAEEVLHLGKLVDDLHLVAVADMGALPCHLEPIDPRPIAERAVERFRERAAARGLAIELTIPQTPVTIDADEMRVAQLLDNLIENGLRYTDAPGKIALSLTVEGPLVRLRVEDTPPGVRREECAQLFEPLHRADAARSRREGGSGLGLTVCRVIAQAHRASISAEPSALGGLAVDVRFPRLP